MRADCGCCRLMVRDDWRMIRCALRLPLPAPACGAERRPPPLRRTASRSPSSCTRGDDAQGCTRCAPATVLRLCPLSPPRPLRLSVVRSPSASLFFSPFPSFCPSLPLLPLRKTDSATGVASRSAADTSASSNTATYRDRTIDEFNHTTLATHTHGRLPLPLAPPHWLQHTRPLAQSLGCT